MKPKSRLDQHLSLLNLDERSLSPEETASEAEFMEAMQPLPLQFPTGVAPIIPKTRWRWYLTTLSMAAATLLLMVYKQPPPESASWIMKGSGLVQIYVEQGGDVKPLQESGPLDPAARFKAEVLAPVPGMAFWGVTSRDGRLLHEANWIWENRLEVGPTGKKFFPGSLQLDGPSEGESVCVVVCPLDLVTRLDSAVITQQLAEMISRKAKSAKELISCTNACFALRP